MRIDLQRHFFDSEHRTLLTHGNITVTAFRYPSGVEALEVKNSRLDFIFTPFKGQQIWHLKVDGREISMQTGVTEPQNTMTYLKNYGGFLYHCGMISFGAPDAEHPHHGEIPNEIYNTAYITAGEDECGKYITLGGSHEHNVAFIRHYRFSPEIKLYENGTVFLIDVTFENLRAYPLEYMYLCHINFRPMDGARLVASTRYDSDHITLYRPTGSEKLDRYVASLEADPSLMTTVGGEEQCYDPEICFGITFEPDECGRAYTMQDTGDGACYVSHPTDVLPYAIRWISRTENEQAMGMCLPATGEHLGYRNAREKGQIKTLAPNATLEFRIEAGWLDKADAAKITEKIKRTIS
jgi:hypothetical protein